MTGTIIRGMGGLYTVKDDTGTEYVLRAKKKLRHQHMTPMVGDHVVFLPGVEEEHGWLDDILPRTNECLRPPVANIGMLVLVASGEPAPDWLLIDKMLIYARKQSIQAVLVINKAELSDETQKKAQEEYAGADITVLSCSARTGEGIDALREKIKGHLTCFAGQSGVGKSTLLSLLLGRELTTGEISEKILRGKNTTRHSELLTGNGLQVFDTPGFSLLDVSDDVMEPVLLQDYYPEFADCIGECRFSPCYHYKEPGCKVLEKVKNNEISAARVERYHVLLEQTRQKWRERYD